MKRFIPVLVVILVLSSLAFGATGAHATDLLTRTLTAPAGTAGLHGTATLTDLGNQNTSVDISALLDANGAPGPASMAAGIYTGYCSDPPPLPSLAFTLTNASGTSATSTTVGASLSVLNTYPASPSNPHYAIVIRDTKQVIVSCVDVGMPSNYVIKPITIFHFPVTGGTLFQGLGSDQLRVVIELQGNLKGSTYPAYVRKGTCSKLDSVPPLYQLEDVVDGKSASILSRDSFLPDGYAVDVEEKPGAALGDYVACVETSPVADQHSCTMFPQTGYTVCDKFLDYWKSHGGLAQQGYPLSDQMQEVSDTNGKTYTVQYFERAVFELHPELQPPNDVLLSLLGDALYKQKYPNGAPGQTPNTSPGSQLFPQTGHRLGGKFLDYWNNHGGLAQQGYPISDEFQEISATDGKVYKVQYFERAVFELHPENQPPNDVLLSLLGTFTYQKKYPNP